MTDATLEETDLVIDWSKYGRSPNGEASAVVRLIERVDRLIAVLERPNAEETLWSAEQIAQWLGLSKQTVELRVVTRPGFPSALRPVDSRQAQRRWFASDVMQWARSTAGTIPASRPGRRRKPV